MKAFQLFLLVLSMATWGMPDLVAQSGKMYVSDVLHVPVRTGPTTGHRIIRHIRSGDSVTVLEFNEGDEYAKIKVQDEKETEGWVIARYLLDEPIAQIKLDRLQRQLDEVKKQQSPLRENVNRLQQELTAAKEQIRRLSGDKEGLGKELAEIQRISSDKIDLHEQNKTLQTELQALQTSLEQLRVENSLLVEDRRNEGIKLGLMAVALGGLAGLILPYMRPRGRKNRSIRL